MTVTRPLAPPDLPAMATMHAAAFGIHAWNETMLNDSLHSTDVWGLLLESAAQPVGFALCQHAGGDSEILTFAIIPAQQRRGLGRHLLQTLYDAAKTRDSGQIFLEVAADNASARRLYTGFGFVTTGIRPGYYPRDSGAVDAILMALKIKTS